ncbi:MAG: mRNA surveillance protein Pelota, partial [Thermosphaera sp.]
RLPGKIYAGNYEAMLNNYIDDVLRQVLDYLSREKMDAVIVSGPGDVKNVLASAIRSRRTDVPVHVDSTSIGGCSGLSELLRRDVVKKVVSELSIVRAREVFEVFKRLVVEQPDRVAYGVDEVYCASLMNAVEKLVVVSDLIKSSDESVRTRVFEILERCYASRSDVWMISGRSDIGVEVAGFGGVIALLRYALQDKTC